MAPDETDNRAERDRLEAVLAAYGADPARWPEADRMLASLLASEDPDLSAPVQDARATDAALARASHPVVPPGAAERLVAMIADKPGRIVSLAGRARERPQPARAALPGRVAALTALAASLVLGLYLGASGRGDWLVPPLLADESPGGLAAELEVLDPTLPLFEDDMEP